MTYYKQRKVATVRVVNQNVEGFCLLYRIEAKESLIKESNGMNLGGLFVRFCLCYIISMIVIFQSLILFVCFPFYIYTFFLSSFLEQFLL